MVTKRQPQARITPLDRQLGEILKARREAEGLTQDELASRIGISKPLLTLMENGKRAFTTSTLFLICDYYKVSLAEFAGGVILSKEDQKILDMMRSLREAEEKADAALKSLKSKEKPKPEA